MIKKTNVQVWKDFINGDKQSLVDLYELNYVGLLNYGNKFASNKDHLNDHLMDMLLNLWENRHKLPEIENVRSYLMTCFRRTVLNRKKQEIWEESTSKIIPEAEAEQSYEQQLMMMQNNESLKRKLVQSLKKLSTRQQELLQLKFFQDLSYDEIALQCNITKRTAYNIVHDALKILRKEMSDGENQISFYELALILTAFSSMLEVIKIDSLS